MIKRLLSQISYTNKLLNRKEFRAIVLPGILISLCLITYFILKPGYQWPLSDGTVVSEFGTVRGFTTLHQGIDIAAPRGTPVAAITDGRVTFTGHKKKYGKTVVMEGQNARILYAHLSKIKVKKGQTIEKGETVGLVGKTGNAQNYHLHLEIEHKGEKVNPRQFLPRF